MRGVRNSQIGAGFVIYGSLHVVDIGVGRNGERLAVVRMQVCGATVSCSFQEQEAGVFWPVQAAAVTALGEWKLRCGERGHLP